MDLTQLLERSLGLVLVDDEQEIPKMKVSTE
jgi:hypothetical protein